MSQLLFRDYTNEELKAILTECQVKSVLTQNAKMKRSSSAGIHLYNFGIPAFKSRSGTLTCPNATKCVNGCYARQGAYIWTNVANAYEARLTLTRTKGFIEVMVSQIDKLVKKHKTGLIMIRVHDSGDFYSKEYQLNWYSIAKAFLHNSRVKFYSYTKMVGQSKALDALGFTPVNFRLIFSLGGAEDNLINQEIDRHSKVFENETDLINSGYADTSHNDTVALGDNPKIGLLYHGVKGYAKTSWSQVS
jgi:hypothetical protein